MPDYIPRTDAEFAAWAQNFYTYVVANQGILGLSPADVAPLTAANGTWTATYPDSLAKQNAAHAAVGLKCQSREAYERVIRALGRRFQALTTVTDAQRHAMGLTVKGEHSTIPTAAPASRPAAIVENGEPLHHKIRFVDAANPSRRAKPAGVMGCEIWVRIGEPPVSESDLTFLALDTASPYLAVYPMSEAGKTAHYRLRWVSTSGEKSAWSEIEAATIAG